MIDIVAQYHADPTWEINPAAVTSDAQIQQAVNENPGAILYLAPGNYRLAKTIDIPHRQVIRGDPSGAGMYLPTCLYWSDGCGGLRFRDDPAIGGAQGSKVSDLTLLMLYRTLPLPDPSRDAQPDGISSNAGIRIERCRVSGFRRHGILINGQTPASAANLFEIRDCQIDGCLDGVHIAGGDSNAGLLDHVSATANEGWGFLDDSSLGNTYLACHTRTNGAGPYSIGVGASGVNASVLLGCYAEGDQPPSRLGDQVYWLGGTNAAGVIGGQLLLPGNSRLRRGHDLSDGGLP